jgi:hypothetical protein
MADHLPSMFNLCACKGPMEGDPYCPCEMQRKGLPFDVKKITWTEDDKARLMKAMEELERRHDERVAAGESK